jgi:hypothetical protein
VRALLVAVLALAACGGDDEEAVVPLVDQIAPAIVAVEDELGGPQRYFEINATPQLVNLFVAGDGEVTPYVYVGGELGPAGAPAAAEGATFTADAVAFDPDRILDGVRDELPESAIVLFTIAGGPGGAVQYGATVQSERGGTLDVVLDPDGSVQSVTAGS